MQDYCGMDCSTAVIAKPEGCDYPVSSIRENHWIA